MHTSITLLIKSLGFVGRTLFSGLMVCLASISVAAAADETVFIEGKDYSRVNPVVSVEVAANQIEVREFFWYGCPHCYALEPYIEKWERPQDVVFVRTPALLGSHWIVHAYTYYALEALGRLDLHNTIFDALHRDRLPLVEADDMANFLELHGVDRDRFRQAIDSFVVKTKIRNAEVKASAYSLRSVPAMVVNGRYVVTTSRFTNYQDVMKVVDFLVAKEKSRISQLQKNDQPQDKDDKPKAQDGDV